MKSRLLTATIALSAVGIVLSGYSLLHNASLVPGTFCDLSETFSCDVVNKGPFSKIIGIPVALIGVIGYVFLALTAALRIKKPDDNGLRLFAFLAALGGLAFSLYLTGIEALVLRVWCIICLTSQATMLAIFILTLVPLKKKTIG